MSKRFQRDPESLVFGGWALGIAILLALLILPWGFLVGPWVWWFYLGVSALPWLFAVALLVLPLFSKYSWKEQKTDDTEN